MQKKVAIVGYGYVGQAMAKLFSNHYEVRIYDPFKPEVSKTKEEINECDLAVLCVPTPMSESGAADLTAVNETLEWLSVPLILIKSTVPPGTTDSLSEKHNKKICFSPEYIGEGNYFTPAWKYLDPLNPVSHTFVIIGGKDEAVQSKIMDFFVKVMSVDTRYLLCKTIEAEITKYMENAYFATKVTFANEFYNICKAFGVDYKIVRELWRNDNRVDPMHTVVFEDNKGFAGKCLPKDVNAIVAASISHGYVPEFLQEVLRSNDKFRNKERV